MSIYIKQTPPWIEKADQHRLETDPKYSQDFAEHVQREKEKWTRGGGSWAKYERDRKAAAMKNKPLWIKRGARPGDREDAIKG